MTDAHSHLVRGETRHLLCEPFVGEVSRLAAERNVVFYGTHPWYLDGFDADALRARLAANPQAGVGEIGLDRLKERNISLRMREIFEAQLRLAAEFRRPVVLHGAKCWGDVVHTIQRLFPSDRQPKHPNTPTTPTPPSFLFHGFSRSGGLLPDIVKLNGYVSIGPAILNDHAVNYRELAKAIPEDRLLVESDATAENDAEVPSVREIAAKLADLRGLTAEALEKVLERNAEAFLGVLNKHE